MDAINIVLQGINNNVQQVESVSHNLANINTPGFIAQTTFSKAMDASGQALVEQHMQLATTATMATSQRALDVALLSDHFFMVEHQGSMAITRYGRFHVDSEGLLRHASGALAVGEKGAIPISSDAIRIDAQGRLFDQGEFVDQLLTASAHKQQTLTNLGNGLYTTTGQLIPSTAEVKQFALNGSAVSSSQDMVKMIELSRHIQSLQRAVQALDQVANAGINELGQR